MKPHSWPAGLASLALLLPLALVWSCDTLECGPGTHRDGDLCVNNVQVSCGEGTVFRDGRCEPIPVDLPDFGVQADANTLGCGEGTHREGDECVPDEVIPERDMRLPDPDDGVPRDAEPDAGEVDAEVDAGPPPNPCEGMEVGQPEACPNTPGRYCVTGVARNFVTNCALPDDQNLAAILVDPIVVAGGGDLADAIRGAGLIGPGGTFTIEGQGDAAQLVLTIDEAPEALMAGAPDLWTRSVTGITPEMPAAGQVFQATAFATTIEHQNIWNAALGFDEQGLETGGFMVGRVLEITEQGLAPKAGAQVRARNNPNLTTCDDDNAPCLRFFSDDPRLIGFQDAGAGATGASGGFLMILAGMPVYQDVFFVQGDDSYGNLPGGASQGSGVHTAFVPR